MKNMANHQQEVDQLFEKKFYYKPQEGSLWLLQPPKNLFREYYQFPELQRLKSRLNETKSKLNDYAIEEWSSHTRRKDPTNEIPWMLKTKTDAEFVTVAWCKFFECLHNYPLVKKPKLNSLHLCEVPGAFIAALNHYLYSNFEEIEVCWNWLSTSLNPYYEGNPFSKMIIDDRLMLLTLDHWLFYDDFTGNIIDANNIDQLRVKTEQMLDGDVHLITADGSVDCVDTPDNQEQYVGLLHFAEIIAALTILADGGSFVLKMFTLFEATSVSKIYFLNCVFKEVHIFKPSTSRRGNSEIYVICLNYKKQTEHLEEILDLLKSKLKDSNEETLPLFAKAHLPRDFLLQHEICVRKFMNLQMQAIESNIYTYENKYRQESQHLQRLRTRVCKNFYTRYKVEPISNELKLLPKHEDNMPKMYKIRLCRGSYSERQQLKITSSHEEIFKLRGQLNELERSNLFREINWMEEDQSDDLVVLKVYRGKAIASLHSSSFTSVELLLMRLKFQNLLNIDPMWCGEPKCQLNHSTEIFMRYNDSTNFAVIQKKFFTTILYEIINQKPWHVMFTNVGLLTHFSVSLLRYLSQHFFNYIHISTSPKVTITLEKLGHCTYDDSKIANLKHLYDLLVNDCGIMCLLDIMQLHQSEFCATVTEYNNFLLLNQLKLMLDH